MNKIIQELNSERATRKLPDFNPGDTVVVQVKVGRRSRARAGLRGVVIAKKNRGLNSCSPCARFARRGVERVFQTFSPPSVKSREAPRRGPPRQAVLLRDLSGKAARIDEKSRSAVPLRRAAWSFE